MPFSAAPKGAWPSLQGGVTINMALLTELNPSPSLKIRIRCSLSLTPNFSWVNHASRYSPTISTVFSGSWPQPGGAGNPKSEVGRGGAKSFRERRFLSIGPFNRRDAKGADRRGRKSEERNPKTEVRRGAKFFRKRRFLSSGPFNGRDAKSAEKKTFPGILLCALRVSAVKFPA